ncbi:aminopeptidase PepB, partial [Vibrio splendidus]
SISDNAAEYIVKGAPAGTVKVKIVKDKDLLTEGWEGITQEGGSERTSAMLQLINPTGDENAPVFIGLVGKGITF